MAGLLIALGVIVVTAMGVGCVILEIRLAERAHPARFIVCCAAWSVTAAATGGMLFGSASLDDAPAGVMAGAFAGIVGYVGMRMRFAMDDWSATQAEEAAKDLERMKYRAVDFGGVAKPASGTQPVPAAARPAKPSPVATPLTPLPRNSALARAAADRRPTWARAAEQGLIALVCVCGAVLFLLLAILDGNGYRSDAGAPAAVAELLEMNGFAATKVKRRMLATHCYQSFAYSWTAMGARGRACVNYYDGEIEVKIDRTWERTPSQTREPGTPGPSAR